MADFSQFLLVSDYDHTLTDHCGQIPNSNLQAISYFMAHGGVFTICTGRSLPASRKVFEPVPMNAPLLFCNGAGCYDLHKEELLFCHPLPPDSLWLIRKCEEQFPDLHLEVHGLDKHYAFHEDPRRDASLRRQQVEFLYVEDWAQIKQPMVKFSLYSRNGDVATLDPESERGLYFRDIAATISQWAGDGFVATLSMPGLIEVQVAGTSKGLAARELAQRLGRKCLVCVGDAPNDLTMLEEADLSFYVSDGDSRMLPYGFPSCASSHEGAIADVIRKLEQL